MFFEAMDFTQFVWYTCSVILCMIDTNYIRSNVYISVATRSDDPGQKGHILSGSLGYPGLAKIITVHPL